MISIQVPPVNASVRIGRILFATDFSACSDQALTYALTIAATYESHLFILHVPPHEVPLPSTTDVVPRLFDFNRHEAEKRIRRLENSGLLSGRAHSILMESNGLWEVMADVIRRHAIDLVVVGTHGRGGIKKLLMGSAAEEVFRLAPCPVLTVGPHTPPAASDFVFRHILFATHYSAGSLHALPYALSLAQQYQAHLMLLHILSETEIRPAPGGKSVLAQARDRLETLLPQDLQWRVAPTVHAEFGSPEEVIVRVAKQQKADLIVMGVHATRAIFISTHLPWNVAHKVVCHAHCPVLTARG